MNVRLCLCSWLSVVMACTVARAQTRVFTTGTPSELERARSIGVEHLTTWARQRGIHDELRVTHVSVDGISMAHVRVQQFYRGIPVLGGEAIAHLKATGEPSGETDALVPSISVDTKPRQTSAAVTARALTAIRCADCKSLSAADLWIVRNEGVDHLAYRVQLRRGGAAAALSLPIVFVDAHTGDVVLRYDNLQTGFK